MPHDDVGEHSSPSADRALLVRFIAGEVSGDEAASVERWLADDPARRIEVTAMRRIWTQAGRLPSDERVEASWRALQTQMREPGASHPERAFEPGREPGRERPTLKLIWPKRSRVRRWMMAGVAAASIVVAAGVTLRLTRPTSLPVFGEAPELVYTTARGQRAVVGLADGSRVELAPDSRFRVRFHKNGRREAHLEGEAVLTVVHDIRRPFLVYAGNAVTEDLGTKFSVRAYPGDTAMQVVVVSGKVALRPVTGDASTGSVTAEAMLEPGDIGELGGDGAPRVRRVRQVETYLSWTQGQLVFRDMPVGEVMAALERWYDVEITVTDALVAARRVTVTLHAPSLEEMLDAVVVPLGLRYERLDGRIVLHS